MVLLGEAPIPSLPLAYPGEIKALWLLKLKGREEKRAPVASGEEGCGSL